MWQPQPEVPAAPDRPGEPGPLGSPVLPNPDKVMAKVLLSKLGSGVSLVMVQEMLIAWPW
jgi:hypothetical protein